ncbi:hypothetical protein POM88_054315 [Heracleum sosnowskyi]|uniref:C2 domain-containing protein n=1 Tax=Heracleum sosnowskyi TaxID=360622 RepID=A0AAD8GP04_9APIA|nr:hypothetical protein POM88_054315 [Heracleum sosnowskyi]
MKLDSGYNLLKSFCPTTIELIKNVNFSTTTTPVPVVENPPVAEKPKPEEKTVTEKRVNLNVTDLELRRLGSDRSRTTYDLVDPMPFLFVRVLKAKRSDKDQADTSVYAKLVIGTHSINTRKQTDNKDWDQVFAFDKEGLNSTSLEVSVCVEKKGAEDSLIESSLGTVSFDLMEVPKRVPPDSPLPPQRYTLDGGSSESTTDVMLAVWIGTQVDEAFQEAWQSDSGGLVLETQAKVYLSPKLWYLRLMVIQAQDLQHMCILETLV